MKIGTKSVLFGAHQFLLHPLVLALAWWKLHRFNRVDIGDRQVADTLQDEYGQRWPCPVYRPEYASLWRPALWVAFIVHDWGYWGKPNMDGPEGELHPLAGAAIMRALFGEPWGRFTLYHSRYFARRDNADPSPLCVADKLAIALLPWWLYLPMTRATGELHEYMSDPKYQDGRTADMSPRQWYTNCQGYVREWVDAHRHGGRDTWTNLRPPEPSSANTGAPV